MSRLQIPESYYHISSADHREGERTYKQDRELASTWITNLRRSQTERKQGRRDLADILEDCEPYARCLSAACPTCSSATQRWMLKGFDNLWPPSVALIASTMIVPKLHRPVGDLSSIKLQSIKRHFRRKFEAADLSHLPIWGFIDLSLNSHADGCYEDHWSPHLAFVTPAQNRSQLKDLGQGLARRDGVKRPLRIDPIDDREAQLSYICKFRPARRVDFDKSTSKARPTKQWLKPAETVEFLLWAQDYHPIERSFMLNLRSYNDGVKFLDKKKLSSTF